MLDRRTTIMLTSLTAAMTLVGGILLMLEPTPRAPMPSLPPLTALDRGQEASQDLFATHPAPEVGRWDAIVIHDSRTRSGSHRTLNAVHENMGLQGLAYHFVISNGRGDEDGHITRGFRWENQLIGAHSVGPDANWLNRRAIGICLIGDGDNESFTAMQMEQLEWLVIQLQKRFGIRAEQVHFSLSREHGQGVGHLFPATAFRQKLINR